jgi:hypothetical protein
MDAKTTDRIAKLRALAEHPNTPEHEAGAARNYLTRLLARIATAPKAQPASGYSWESRMNFVGKKYDSNLTLTEISKRIKAEIKLARKYGAGEATPGSLATVDPIGQAPAGIKFSVRQPHYGAIDITLSNLPAAWAWERGYLQSHAGPIGKETWVETSALRALKVELKLLMSAYNYDGSDVMTDYFDVRFYGDVRVDWSEVPRG